MIGSPGIMGAYLNRRLNEQINFGAIAQRPGQVYQ